MSTRPRNLGLIADDVTGAGDASVQFARHGWDTFLSLEPWEKGTTARRTTSEVRLKPDTTYRPTYRANDRSGVIAVTTDCRALDNDTAHQLTRDALAHLIDAGIDRVFLKIDSTMRGSVRGQISGALAAWRSRHADAQAIVCPAYPRMGRTVQRSQVLVHGQPVEQTAIGRDPVTPVTSSDMTVLVPESPVITLADAATDDGLVALAGAIAAASPAVIAVGSGGLAEALASVWSGDRGPDRPDQDFRIGSAGRTVANPRMLLLVTSLNPVSRLQVTKLREAFPDVAVVLAPERREEPASVAERLAEEFSQRVLHERWDMVGLIGGDGARAALKRLGASGIRIAGSLLEGIPAGVIVGGTADGLPVFTKAGGFGAEDALVRVVRGFREHPST